MADGATLNAKHGICCVNDSKLKIYGQRDMRGKIVVDDCCRGDAAIGGNNEHGTGGNITINGGIINAKGSHNAAGIGGGNGRPGKNITINAGYVNAQGGENAAGIGSGDTALASDITINGGNIFC